METGPAEPNMWVVTEPPDKRAAERYSRPEMKEMEDGRIEIFYNRANDLFCFIICALLIVIGAFICLWGEGMAAPFGIQLTLPGIIGVCVLAKRVFKPAPVIVLDSQGITDFSKKAPWFIRWEDVIEVYCKRVSFGYVVIIQPTEHRAFSSTSCDAPAPTPNAKLARQLPVTEKNYRELHALLNSKLSQYRSAHLPSDGETKFVEYPRT